MRLVALGGVVLLGASCATPYQHMGIRGGVEDEEVGEDTHVIRVAGNAYTSTGTVYEYVHRRAAELCPTGYDVLDSFAEDRYKGTYVLQNAPAGTATAIAINKPEMVARIRCRHDGRMSDVAPSAPPPLAAAEPDPPPAAPVPPLSPAAPSPPSARALDADSPSGRRAYARELDAWMAHARPPIHVSTDDDDATTIVFIAKSCGQGKGVCQGTTELIHEKNVHPDPLLPVHPSARAS